MILNQTTNPIQLEINHRELDELLVNNSVEIKVLSNSYTAKQRRALHLWCELLATALNDAGMQLERLSLINGDIVKQEWSKETVKELIYKPILESLTGKTSTEEQTSVNPSDVAAHITRHFASKGFVCPAWPSLR